MRALIFFIMLFALNARAVDAQLKALGKEMNAEFDKAHANHFKGDGKFLVDSQNEWLKSELPKAVDKEKEYQARIATLENWWSDSFCEHVNQNNADYLPAVLSNEHKTITIDGKSIDIDLGEQGTATNSSLNLPYSISTVTPWNVGCAGCNEKVLMQNGKYFDVGYTSDYAGGVRMFHVSSVTILSSRGFQVPICQAPIGKSHEGKAKLTLDHNTSLCTKFLGSEAVAIEWPRIDTPKINFTNPEVLEDSSGPDGFSFIGATIEADLSGTKTRQTIAHLVKNSGAGPGCDKDGLAVSEPANAMRLQDFSGPDGALAKSLNGLSRELSCDKGKLNVVRLNGGDYVESIQRKSLRRLYSLKDGRAEMVCEVRTPIIKDFKIFVGHGGTKAIEEK